MLMELDSAAATKNFTDRLVLLEAFDPYVPILSIARQSVSLEGEGDGDFLMGVSYVHVYVSGGICH
jgi:hypothetical protein